MTQLQDLISIYTSQSEFSNLLESDKFGLVMIESFSVTGDGVTDDSTGVQKAIDYAISTGSNVVALKGGTTYAVSGLTDTSSVTFIGQNSAFVGQTITVINLDDLATYSSMGIFNVIIEGFDNSGLTSIVADLNSLLSTIGTDQADIYFPNGSYLIDSNVTIPDNVNLIMANGAKFVGSLGSETLTINGGVNAGLWQIFDNIVIEGDIQVTTTYPQWFGDDNSSSIQSAIDIWGTKEGLVLTPFSSYTMNETVVVPDNITFDGGDSDFIPSATGTFIEDYMFLINSTDGLNWTNAFSSRHNEFRNVRFSNENSVVDAKGVFLAGQYKLYNIKSSLMYQTIVKTQQYLDVVDIDMVDISEPLGTGYHIDCGFIGDALKVSRVHMRDAEVSGNINCIKVSGCNAGKIENIINGSIYLDICNAISLNSLHIEFGTLTIENSSFTVNDVFQFYVDETPLVIRGEQTGGATGYKRTGKISNYNVIYNNAKNDISADTFDAYIKDSIVSISNFYKLYAASANVSQSIPLGVRITYDGTNEHYFNKDSSHNSMQSVITSTNDIKKDFLNYEILSGLVYWFNASIPDYTNDTWELATGTYYYKMQEIADLDRLIGKNDSEPARSKSSVLGNNASLLIIFGNHSGKFVRLYRGTAANVYDYYVDVPWIIAQYIVDNGIHICGYAWKSRTAADTDTIFDTCTKVEKKGENVICYGSATPTVGTWTKFDRIINSDVQVGSVKSWIYDGSSWLSEGTY